MSESVVMLTAGGDWRKVRSTNTTDASFPTRFSSATRPSGTGNNVAQATASAVIDLTANMAGGADVQNAILVMPYGVGSDTNTGSIRIYGWSRVPDLGTPDTETWICIILAEMSFIASSSLAGIGSRQVGSTQLFATTIANVIGNSGINNDILSPGSGIQAHAVVDLKGCQVIEITFKTGSSLTSCNALARLL